VTNPDDAAGANPHDSALARMTSAFAEIVTQIKNNPDRRRGYEDATNLATTLRRFADEAAGLRAMMTAMIFDQDKLSLLGLAQIVGVSKQRASQMVQSGRKVMESVEHDLPANVTFYGPTRGGDDDDDGTDAGVDRGVAAGS
jgi:hypothetical protein